jgi:hypothetical protein
VTCPSAYRELGVSRVVHRAASNVICRGSICQACVVRSVVRPAGGVVRSASVLSVFAGMDGILLRGLLIKVVFRVYGELDCYEGLDAGV